MKRSFPIRQICPITLLLLLQICSDSHAQTKRLVIRQKSLIDNEFIFGSNAASPPTMTQRLLTTRKGLSGMSFEETVIRPDGSVTGGAAFVATTDFPNGSGAAIGPVENIQINGGQGINFELQDVDVAHAVKISTEHVRVRNCLITGWRGNGVQTGSPLSFYSTSSNKIEGNVIEYCHTGIVATSDVAITNNTILAIRDYGINGGASTTGNVFISGNYIYGCNGQDVSGVHDGICVYNPNGSGWRLVDNTLADSHFGYVSGGGNANLVTISACFFSQNTKHNCKVSSGATNHTIDACQFYISRGTNDADFDDVMGIELAGNRSRVSNSLLWLSNYKHDAVPGAGNSMATGLRVSGHANSCVSTTFLDYDAPAGYARGIHVDGVVRGFRADVQMWGFEDVGDVFLDIDSASIQGVHVVIRGNSIDSPGFDATDIAQYVDIPAMWDGTKNSITLVNEATGQTVTATGGTAY
jgi:hypothetical protein